MPAQLFIPPLPPAEDLAPAPSPAGSGVRILCLGDVVGRPGRQMLRAWLPFLRKTLSLDMVVANGENAAGGIGLTPDTARELLEAGVNVITSGNHIWKHREISASLTDKPHVLRPANYGPKAPGSGMHVHTLPSGDRVAVINLLGRTFMEPVDNPFTAAACLLEELKARQAQNGREWLCLVDFHAEATSEKKAMALYLDGKVSAVLGTHTHVQTADPRLLPGGTAAITDLGMCGVEEDSILGMAPEPIVSRMVTGLPHPFRPARGMGSLNGALVLADARSGRATSIHAFRANQTQLEQMRARLLLR